MCGAAGENGAVRFGIEVVTLGQLADPGLVMALGQAAEEAGWDGVFVWDHLAYAWGVPSADPWVVLSAIAAVTTRVRLGTWVTPVPRRRPHVLAQTITSLDILSHGRTVFGVGLGGVEQEFSAFGEEPDARLRGARLDEGLGVLDRLWRGERINHRGPHYTVQGVELTPLPVQRPRVPIWVGGESPSALRRAARWDGWAAVGAARDGTMRTSPDDIAGAVAVIQAYRVNRELFEVALDGYSQHHDGSVVRAYRDAGVTWWLEILHGERGSSQELLGRVREGPPGG